MQNVPPQEKQQQQQKQANEQGNGNMFLPETQMLAYFYDYFAEMQNRS